MPVCTADNSTHKTPETLRKHLHNWIKANPESAPLWAVDYLKQRQQEKKLIYAPSQAELRTLYCPTMAYYDFIGGYNKITYNLGFKPRYIEEPLRFLPFDKSLEIICDTREQKPLKFPYKTINQKLDWGDYALSSRFDIGIRIERKGCGDFWGTFSSKKIEHKKITTDTPCQRFERELIRAQEANGYLIMMVESSVGDTEKYREHSKFGKAGSAHVFKNMRDLLAKYPLRWQVIFVDGRHDMSTKLIKIFEMGLQAKRIDLQYSLEKGEL